MDLNFEIFRPKEYLESVYSIDFDRLKAKGIKAVIMDMDETLLPREMLDITPVLFSFIQDLRDRGFNLCLVSNSVHQERVDYVSRTLKLPSITMAAKPFPFAFDKALRLLGARRDQAVIIGDQLFMDIFGGNLAGIYTILVKPMTPEKFWLRQWMRKAEGYVLEKLGLML
ncbi:MAG TPA: YqeG family HAD IIIA-type phosphatase [Candidatus Omnitrophota bacterium]|nr:YqeG family HAD IIIA-type phosphatase [Candidatus Omnitrophota bacterium]